MEFENQFDELDGLLLMQSTDYANMRAKLQAIRQLKEFTRLMGDAQDRLYASIASRHLSVLRLIEAGKIEDAQREAAVAIAWFYARFRHEDPTTMPKHPRIAELFQSISEEAVRCNVLREIMEGGGDKLAV